MKHAKPWFIIFDATAIIIFTLIGRRNHTEPLNPVGILETAWPFLVAASLGISFVLVRKLRGTALASGLIIWSFTWPAGMLVRLIGGGSVAFSFLIVAGVFLAVFIFGWRLIFSATKLLFARQPA